MPTSVSLPGANLEAVLLSSYQYLHVLALTRDSQSIDYEQHPITRYCNSAVVRDGDDILKISREQLQLSNSHLDGCTDHSGRTLINSLVADGVDTMDRDEESVGDIVGLSNTHETMIKRCLSRRLIISDAGLTGLRLSEAGEGDCICVFVGCVTPFLLRCVDHAGEWIVVGE